jgi:predicted NBD/HSP70 family sugar kinase
VKVNKGSGELSRFPQAGNRSGLRITNSLAVLQLIQQEDHTSKSLVEHLGISRTAVETVLAELMESKWIIARADKNEMDEPASVGRPTKSFTLNSDAGCIASLDIGAHHIYAIIADLHGNTLAYENESISENLSANSRLSQSNKILTKTLALAGKSADDLWLLTLGSPGIVENGVVTFYGGRGLPGWVGLDLKAFFMQKVQCEVVLEGNVNLGTIAEKWKGKAVEEKDYVYFYSGTRTGFGYYLDGLLRRGSRGATGLIGHLPELRWDEIENSLYIRSDSETKTPDLSQLFTDARLGVPKAKRAVEEFSQMLALGVSAVCLTLDPQLIVIGGPNSTHGDLFLETFQRELAARYPLNIPEIKLSILGLEGPCLGGVKLALDLIKGHLLQMGNEGKSLPKSTPTEWRQAVRQLA